MLGMSRHTGNGDFCAARPDGFPGAGRRLRRPSGISRTSGTTIEAIRRIGASCDWSRERFTMDEQLSRAVNEVFIRLYEEGLIYRGEYIVNWCPRCKTALSDVEVEHADLVATEVEPDRLRTLEFKMEPQGLEEHEWWLDEVSLNLEAQDPYPYAPRLAISLTPYGQNPWRGPTLVHYAQPLAPYLAGALEIARTYVQLHADAQDEFQARCGGVKGPIMPVHTRNDIENIALLGSENFNRFCWWPDYPETACGLAQYWAFMKLAQYHAVSGDETAWNVLDNWLNWLDSYGVEETP